MSWSRSPERAIYYYTILHTLRVANRARRPGGRREEVARVGGGARVHGQSKAIEWEYNIRGECIYARLVRHTHCVLRARQLLRLPIPRTALQLLHFSSLTFYPMEPNNLLMRIRWIDKHNSIAIVQPATNYWQHLSALQESGFLKVEIAQVCAY